MAEPILLPDGTAVTNWDKDTIEVTGQTGQKVRIARAAAPAALQQTVQRAEMGQGGPATLVPSAQSSSPYGNIDINTPGPGVKLPSTRSTPPTTPQGPGDPAPTPIAGAMSSPMAAVDAEIARLRSQPQTAMSGGGVRKTTSTTKIPDAAADELRDMQTPIDESVAEQQLAIEDQAGAEEAGFGEVSKLHAQQGQRIERELQDQETLKASYEQRFSTEQQKLEQLSAAAQTEIDPKRYWKDKGTGNKILAAISMAVGAFVHARSEGRVANTPAQIIQTAIDRDIAAQVENRNRAERDVSRQAGIVGLVQDKYSDDLQKRQAALVLANEAVAKQIDGAAAGMHAGQAKAKALQLSAQLRQDNAQRAQAFAAQLAGSETVQTQQVPGGPVATGAKRQADALSEAAYGPGAVFDHETYIPASMTVAGEARAANSKADAVAINTSMGAVQDMLRKVDTLEEISKTPTSKLSPQAKRNAATLHASLLLDAKKAVLGEAIDQKTGQVLEDLIGQKPTDITSMGNAYPQLRSTLRAGAQTQLRNRTHAIDPTTIPLAARQRGGGAGVGTAPPATRPLAEEEDR